MSVQSVPNSEVAALTAVAITPLAAGAVTTWAANGQLAGGSYADYTEVAKPASPPVGTLRIYTKSDDRLYTLNSAGIESALAARGVGITIPLGQHLTFAPDNTYDIGAAAATRPRTIYAGTSVVTPTVASTAALNLTPSGANGTRIVPGTAGGVWQFTPSGHLAVETDNVSDIGTSGANRPRSIYAGTSVVAPSVVASTSVDTPIVGTTVPSALQLRANNIAQWQITATGGQLRAVVDNATDLGSSALRVRNIVRGGFEEATEIPKPSNPAAGAVRVYPKADHKLYLLDSTGAETDLSALGLTQTQADARYLQLTGGALSGALTITGPLTVSGVLTLGGSDRIIRTPASSTSLSIEASSQYLMLASKSGTHVGGNAYWDGANWQRWDTTTGSSVWIASPNGITYLAAPAGSGVVPLANKFTIDLTGRLSYQGGGYIQDYGSSYVQISELTVTPGPLAAATINCNGPLNNAAISGSCTIADAVQHLGWMRMNGPAGIYNTTYGIGIQFTDAVGPRFYASSYASGELMQSHARHDETHRVATGGNVTLDPASYDGAVVNTGTYIYLPDLNQAYGRVMFVKNVTGAAFNVYVTNGNGIYSNTWANPFTLQQGDSITVYASPGYVGWMII